MNRVCHHGYRVRQATLILFNLLHTHLPQACSAGAGLYPLSALINHSCRPNAAQVFDHATIQIRAVEPISTGVPL